MRKAGPCLTSLLLILSSSNVARADGLPAGNAGEGLVIEPEHSTTIAVSDRDINRIYCSAGLNDYLWSKEKPVSVDSNGDNVLVKFLVKRVGDHETRAKDPVDLHVFCGGEVYTLILTPYPMDSVTLRLGNPVKQSALAINKEWGTLPLEDKVKKFTLAVYRDELPASFKKLPLTPDARAQRLMGVPQSDYRSPDGQTPWTNVFVRGVERVTAPGLGLTATEYEVQPRQFPLTFTERDFLSSFFGRDIVAVTVQPLTVTADKRTARVIVIERSLGNVH